MNSTVISARVFVLTRKGNVEWLFISDGPPKLIAVAEMQNMGCISANGDWFTIKVNVIHIFPNSALYAVRNANEALKNKKISAWTRKG